MERERRRKWQAEIRAELRGAGLMQPTTLTPKAAAELLGLTPEEESRLRRGVVGGHSAVAFAEVSRVLGVWI